MILCGGLEGEREGGKSIHNNLNFLSLFYSIFKNIAVNTVTCIRHMKPREDKQVFKIYVAND